MYFTESFTNTSYAARGWYGVSGAGSGIDSGMGHWTWDIGDSNANEGYPSNRLLDSNATPTMTVTTPTIYMSFDFKVGANWNNGDLPHILGFMTNGETIADPINGLNEWDGPSVATGYYSFQTVGLKAAVYFADGERIFDDVGATYPHNNATPSLLGTTGAHAAFGGNGFQTGYSTAFYSAGQNAHRFDSASNVFTPGVTHHVEVYFAMSSFSGGADVGDGIAKVWVDGNLVINLTGLYFRTPGYEAQQFGRVQLIPSFPTPVSAAQEMWMDNLVIANQQGGSGSVLFIK